MKEEDKFVFTISCNPRFETTPKDDITSITEKICTMRIKQIDEGIIGQLREIGRENGVNTLIAIDESKVLNFIKKVEAFEIIKSKDVTIGAIKALTFKEYNMYAKQVGTKMLTREEYNSIREAMKCHKKATNTEK